MQLIGRFLNKELSKVSRQIPDPFAEMMYKYLSRNFFLEDQRRWRDIYRSLGLDPFTLHKES